MNLAMRTGLATLVLAATLSSNAAYAIDGTPRMPDRGNAVEGSGGARVDDLVRALGLAVRSLPEYAPPEINERGDIVIRRREAPARRAVPPPRRIEADEASI
jgi:hypothetical protein